MVGAASAGSWPVSPGGAGAGSISLSPAGGKAGTLRTSFSLPGAAYINLTIYDASGSVLSELVGGWLYAGHYSVSFDATGMLPSGIYFYRLSGGEFRSAGKMVLMK